MMYVNVFHRISWEIWAVIGVSFNEQCQYIPALMLEWWFDSDMQTGQNLKHTRGYLQHKPARQVVSRLGAVRRRSRSNHFQAVKKPAYVRSPRSTDAVYFNFSFLKSVYWCSWTSWWHKIYFHLVPRVTREKNSHVKEMQFLYCFILGFYAGAVLHSIRISSSEVKSCFPN